MTTTSQVGDWIRVCDEDAITPGEASVLDVDPPVAVWNVDGELYATDDTCTHEDFSLAEGYIDGCQVECALHWAKFDVRTGEALCLPASSPLRTYPVRVSDGVLFVDLSSRARTMESPATGDDSATVPAAALDEAARRLQEAASTGVPCAPVRDLIGSTDVAAAYAVQQRLTTARLRAEAVIVGRKIGLTSPAVQAQLGVDRPDFGVLFADMLLEPDEAAPMGRLLQPKVEAEIAFVLGADLDGGPLDAEQVRAAVAYAVAALEIVDSRIEGWDITFADTVADNASSGLFVLGTQRRDLTSFEPVEAQMSMRLDGEVVSTGSGKACLGDPLEALRWLATTARELGQPLRAGQVVLSGALGPMVTVGPGAVVSATITGLGEVRTTFGTGDPKGTQR